MKVPRWSSMYCVWAAIWFNRPIYTRGVVYDESDSWGMEENWYILKKILGLSDIKVQNDLLVCKDERFLVILDVMSQGLERVEWFCTTIEKKECKLSKNMSLPCFD